MTEDRVMNRGETYWRTKDLRPYKVRGEQIMIPEGMAFEQTYYVLCATKGEDTEVKVFDGINMNTTRDWATSEDMAIANKMKLLENEIVMLQVRRDSLPKS